MKGPLAFFASLVGVGVLGALLILPALEERGSLEARILDRASRLDPARRTEEPPAIGRLAAAIGLGRGEDDPGAAARSVALEFAPMDRILLEGRRASFPVDWKEVPRLIRALAARRGLVLREFRAEPDGTGEKCRITLVFAAPAAGFGVR